jgi:hypothetical protein
MEINQSFWLIKRKTKYYLLQVIYSRQTQTVMPQVLTNHTDSPKQRTKFKDRIAPPLSVAGAVAVTRTFL